MIRFDPVATYAAANNYAVLTSIAPGEGYWVNAQAAINLPAQATASPSPPALPQRPGAVPSAPGGAPDPGLPLALDGGDHRRP